MNFATRNFFIFLPIVLLIYHALPSRSHKYRFLLAASWFFYMSWNPWFIWVILVTSVVDYFAGRFIEDAPTAPRRRLWLTLSIVSNLGFLAFFKYTNFLVHNGLAVFNLLGGSAPDWTVDVILPLGISFHTFQGISYTLDVYRQKIRAVRNFVDFGLFVAFFPQLVAGPIVRATEFLPQMETPPRPTGAQLIEGLHWFLLGLVKKVFVADRLATFVDQVFATPLQFDAACHRWAVLAYAAQIYCDFSGYSDMAIGCAKWFGFELPRNFNFPYLAGSIAEFWRRWHMTLSNWMRDYLYFSMGGSRHSRLRTHFNLIATMTLCGLWHGASWNYILWGFYNGVLLMLHRFWDRLLEGRAWAEPLRSGGAYRLLSVLATFLLVAAGWVMLRAQSWEVCWQIERSLLGGSTAADLAGSVPAWVPLLVALVAAGHLFSGLRDCRCRILQLPTAIRAAAYLAMVVAVVIFGHDTTKPFIYFQF
jgi:alginate O-acetyltransferase complex protein AlgI